MPKYHVSFEAVRYYSGDYEIEAESQEEAQEIANDDLGSPENFSDGEESEVTQLNVWSLDE